jgi:hypothetical protein
MSAQSVKGGGGLDIHQYSFAELLNVFDLKPNLTEDDLKRTRRHVLSLHPDKNRSVSAEHYMFFKGAFDMITSYYKSNRAQTAELPTEDIEYDPWDIVYKNKTIYEEIGAIDRKQFNQRFNNIYESKVVVPEDTSRLDWFRNTDETPNYTPLKSEKDIHNSFDEMRSRKQGMVIYNGEFRPLTWGGHGGNSFYDEKETDANGYITCNPFDKLKYDDITRVHRDQTIIPVDNNEFARANQQRDMNEYKKGVEPQDMKDKRMADRLMTQKMEEYNAIMLEKQHKLQQKISANEKMNGDILSQFMLLR